MMPLTLNGKLLGGARLPEAAAAIKRWTRAALGVGPEVVVSVSELACAVPGCAPRETVVLVLRADAPTRKLSVHKPLVDVTEADVLMGWSNRAGEETDDI